MVNRRIKGAKQPREAAAIQKLLSPSELGELFKVIALRRGSNVPLLGFDDDDQSYRLWQKTARPAPENCSLFEAIKAVIPYGQCDYSRLAATARGGRVRVRQSKPRRVSAWKVRPA